MKLSQFLEPETKNESTVHKNYRFDNEIAKQILKS